MSDTPRTDAESTLHSHGLPDPEWIAPNGACALCARNWAERLRDDLARLTAENEALRKQVAAAMQVINFGVELMPLEQIGQWEGVRAFLERDTESYLEGS